MLSQGKTLGEGFLEDFDAFKKSGITSRNRENKEIIGIKKVKEYFNRAYIKRNIANLKQLG